MRYKKCASCKVSMSEAISDIEKTLEKEKELTKTYSSIIHSNRSNEALVHSIEKLDDIAYSGDILSKNIAKDAIIEIKKMLGIVSGRLTENGVIFK